MPLGGLQQRNRKNLRALNETKQVFGKKVGANLVVTKDVNIEYSLRGDTQVRHLEDDLQGEIGENRRKFSFRSAPWSGRGSTRLRPSRHLSLLSRWGIF